MDPRPKVFRGNKQAQGDHKNTIYIFEYNISDLSELHDGSKRWKGSTVGTFVARRLLGKKFAAGGNANSASMNQEMKARCAGSQKNSVVAVVIACLQSNNLSDCPLKTFGSCFNRLELSGFQSNWVWWLHKVALLFILWLSGWRFLITQLLEEGIINRDNTCQHGIVRLI